MKNRIRFPCQGGGVGWAGARRRRGGINEGAQSIPKSWAISCGLPLASEALEEGLVDAELAAEEWAPYALLLVAHGDKDLSPTLEAAQTLDTLPLAGGVLWTTSSCTLPSDI